MNCLTRNSVKVMITIEAKDTLTVLSIILDFFDSWVNHHYVEAIPQNNKEIDSRYENFRLHSNIDIGSYGENNFHFLNNKLIGRMGS